MKTQFPLPNELVALLARVRHGIRRYLLVQGLAAVAVIIGLGCWFSLSIDWLYFQVSHLELPRWFRASIVLLTLTGAAVGLVVWVLWRMFSQLRDRSLAVVVERRFPEFDDRLIAAVEAAEGELVTPTPLAATMLRRTVDEAVATSKRVDSNKLFLLKPLRQVLVLAAVLVITFLGTLAANGATLERWLKGYVELDDNYWNRRTVLTLKAILQPGDRHQEFVNHTVAHARGGDLTLLVQTEEGKQVPDRVRLDYRLGNGRGSGRAYLTADGQGRFVHVFPGLLDDLEIWVYGGDFASLKPHRVQLVDAPVFDRVSLLAKFPAYTGLNRSDDSADGQLVAVQGSQVSLPIGTEFQLIAEASKPLGRVRFEGSVGAAKWELLLERSGSGTNETGAIVGRWLVQGEKSPKGVIVPIDGARARSWLSSDGKRLTLPLVIPSNGFVGTEKLALELEQSGTSPTGPLLLPADVPLKIYLEDTTRIASTEPARLTIAGIVDESPIIETKLTGIGLSITRGARVPLTGTIRDDYGIADAAFEFQVGEAGEPQRRDFSGSAPAMSNQYVLQRTPTQPFERFDLLQLGLEPKQQLTLSVVATDNQALEGLKPNSARSQRYVFTVVTNEELLSALYSREINLRKRFQQIITEVEGARRDLGLLPLEGSETKAAIEDESDRETAASPAVISERVISSLRKNGAETEAIQAGFVDIREELVNNSVDTPQALERLERKIIGPLGLASKETFPRIDETLGLLRLAVEQQQPTGRLVAEAIRDVDELLVVLKGVLDEMSKPEDFNKALELLKSIIAEQKKLEDEAKKIRKARALKALE